MTVKQYLEEKASPSMHITFIKARARKDNGTPFYHAEYQTTPLLSRGEWLNDKLWKANEKLLDSVILNDKAMPLDWLSGADWSAWVRKGIAKCLIVISREDMELLMPSEAQRRSTEKYIEKKIG